MRAAFADIFDARLIGLLRGQLQPLQQELQEELKIQSIQVMTMRSELQLYQEGIQGVKSKLTPDPQLMAILSQLEGQDVNLKSVSEAIKQHLSTRIPPLNIQDDVGHQEGSSTLTSFKSQEPTGSELINPTQTRFLRKALSRESLTEV